MKKYREKYRGMKELRKGERETVIIRKLVHSY
jgi:hypothetical protein